MAGKTKDKLKKTKPKTKLVKQKQKQKQSTRVIVNIDNSKKSTSRGGGGSKPREIMHTTSQVIQPFPMSQNHMQHYAYPNYNQQPIEQPTIGTAIANVLGETPAQGYLQLQNPTKRHILAEQPKDIRELWASNSDDQSFNTERNFADFFSPFDKTPVDTIPIYTKQESDHKEAMQKLDDIIQGVDETIKKRRNSRTAEERNLAKDILRQQISDVTGYPPPTEILNNEKLMKKYLREKKKDQKQDSNYYVLK